MSTYKKKEIIIDKRNAMEIVLDFYIMFQTPDGLVLSTDCYEEMRDI